MSTPRLQPMKRKIDDVNSRMDQRLTVLEDLMKNSARIKRRSNELRDKELNYINDTTEKVIPTEAVKSRTVEPPKDMVDKVDRVTNEILTEPVGTFRSSWAQGIQRELIQAAKEADKKQRGQS